MTVYRVPRASDTVIADTDGQVMSYDEADDRWEPRERSLIAGSVSTYDDLPATPTEGQTFVVRDEVALYTWDGAAWEGPVPVQGAATDAAVAAAVQTPTVRNVLTRTGSKPVGQGEIVINARDYGATGHGSIDDTAAIQAAINAAGPGGRVYLPPGNYYCASTIEVPLHATLEGGTAEPTIGGLSVTQLKFSTHSGSQVGVNLANGASLRNVTVRGPGSNAGTCRGITGRMCHLERLTVIGWNTGIDLVDSYYTKIRDTKIKVCFRGIRLATTWTIDLHSVDIHVMGSDGTTPGIGIETGSVKSLTMFGGSIEGFGGSGAVRVTGNQGMCTFLGTYFEQMTAGVTAWGIEASLASGNTINLYGCMVYLTNVARFVQIGSQTDVTLNAQGNTYVSPSTGTSIIYQVTAASGRQVNISGDRIIGTGAVTYCNGINAGPAEGFNVSPPPNVPTQGGRTYIGRDFYLGGSDILAGTGDGVKFGVSASEKIAFYGATPRTRPELSYSRTSEPASVAQIRIALAQLGLVTDGTTA